MKAFSFSAKILNENVRINACRHTKVLKVSG